MSAEKAVEATPTQDGEGGVKADADNDDKDDVDDYGDDDDDRSDFYAGLRPLPQLRRS